MSELALKALADMDRAIRSLESLTAEKPDLRHKEEQRPKRRIVVQDVRESI